MDATNLRLLEQAAAKAGLALRVREPTAVTGGAYVTVGDDVDILPLPDGFWRYLDAEGHDADCGGFLATTDDVIQAAKE